MKGLSRSRRCQRMQASGADFRSPASLGKPDSGLTSRQVEDIGSHDRRVYVLHGALDMCGQSNDRAVHG